MKNIFKWNMLFLAVVGFVGIKLLQAEANSVVYSRRPVGSAGPIKLHPVGLIIDSSDAIDESSSSSPSTPTRPAPQPPAAVDQVQPAMTDESSSSLSPLLPTRPTRPAPMPPTTALAVRQLVDEGTSTAKKKSGFFSWFNNLMRRGQGKKDGDSGKDPVALKFESIDPTARRLYLRLGTDKSGRNYYTYVTTMMNGFKEYVRANGGNYDKDIADAMTGLSDTLTALDEDKATVKNVQNYIADLYTWWYNNFDHQPVQQNEQTLRTIKYNIGMARQLAQRIVARIGNSEFTFVDSILRRCEQISQDNGEKFYTACLGIVAALIDTMNNLIAKKIDIVKAHTAFVTLSRELDILNQGQ